MIYTLKKTSLRGKGLVANADFSPKIVYVYKILLYNYIQKLNNFTESSNGSISNSYKFYPEPGELLKEFDTYLSIFSIWSDYRSKFFNLPIYIASSLAWIAVHSDKCTCTYICTYVFVHFVAVLIEFTWNVCMVIVLKLKATP